jgi:hypothetical protein
MLSDTEVRNEMLCFSHGKTVSEFVLCASAASKHIYTGKGSMVAIWINIFTVLPVGRQVHA